LEAVVTRIDDIKKRWEGRGPWQRSRFVDGPKYRDMPAAWKELRGYEEELTIRGPGVVGTPGCNAVLWFRQGTADADIHAIAHAPEDIAYLLQQLEAK
jgi:hypothetical protein